MGEGWGVGEGREGNALLESFSNVKYRYPYLFPVGMSVMLFITCVL